MESCSEMRIGMKPTLVFDYDGTIHNTMSIYEPAFRRCYAWLIQQGCAPKQDIPAARIAGWLGMNSREMWNSFMPNLPEEIKEEASRRVGNAMVELILAHRAKWYPGAEAVLDELKAEGFPMVILSNCKIAYREANWKEFHMERWFRAFYDCESFGFAPKTEIIKVIRKNYAEPFVIIGDRSSDMECARSCHSIFIGCAYGYGKEKELRGADALADSIRELPERVCKCCEV